jgi:hypothetical protein
MFLEMYQAAENSLDLGHEKAKGCQEKRLNAPEDLKKEACVRNKFLSQI